MAIERLIELSGIEAGAPDPLLQGFLGDGSQFTLISEQLTLGYPAIIVRRAQEISAHLSIDALISAGALSGQLAGTLQSAVSEGRGLVICGRSAMARTALLWALADGTGPRARFVLLDGNSEQPGEPSLGLVRLDREAVVQSEGSLAAVVAEVGATHLAVPELGGTERSLPPILRFAALEPVALLASSHSASCADLAESLDLALAVAHPTLTDGIRARLLRGAVELLVAVQPAENDAGLTVSEISRIKLDRGKLKVQGLDHS